MARAVGDCSLADKVKVPVNAGMVLFAKARDRNVNLRLAVRSRAGFGKLHGSSGIDILLCGFGWLIGPDLSGHLACLIASLSSCAAWRPQ